MKTICTFLTLFILPFLLFAQGEKGVVPVTSIVPSTAPSTRAVVIGISDYQDPAIPDLQFADRDAEAFAEWLRSPAGGSVPEDNMKVLLNNQATLGQFVVALDWLREYSREGDHVIIYFSGHGDVDAKLVGQPGFLLFWDTPSQTYMSGAYGLFYFQLVISTLSEQNKAKVIVITDACHAGKLAETPFGGPQVANAALLKQFSKEVKILSCQPDEFSVEGEQWGGGRGAFSYYLVDGLYGMADENGDQTVNLLEIGRYLEDHVSAEVAPMEQTPMIIGDKKEPLATVAPEELALWLKKKSGQPIELKPVDQRNQVESILADVDSSIRQLYRDFQQSLSNKNFLEPADACTNAYYEQLMAEVALKPLWGGMTRNFAAALMDDSQQALNRWMQTDLREMEVYQPKVLMEKYRRFPQQLERASELLGTNHYLYAELQARKHFFEGFLLHPSVSFSRNAVAIRQAIQHFKKALEWQPEFPLAYCAISYAYAPLGMEDSASYYAFKTLELAPRWQLAYDRVFEIYIMYYKHPSKCLNILETAKQLDSTAIWLWLDYAWLYAMLGQFEASENMYFKALEQDSTFHLTYTHLGFLYLDYGMSSKAETTLLKALSLAPESAAALNSLGSIYTNTGQFLKAISNYWKAIEQDPGNDWQTQQLIKVYRTMGQLKAAVPAVLAITQLPDGNHVGNYYQLGLIYLDLGRLDSARWSFEQCLLQEPDRYHGYLGMSFLRDAEGQSDEAFDWLEQAFQRNLPSDLLENNNYLASMQSDGRFEALLKKVYERDIAKNLHALNVIPDNLTIYTRLVVLYINNQQYDKADTIFNKSYTLDSTISRWIGLGWSLFYERRYKEMEYLLRKCVALAPSNHFAWNGLGWAILRQQRYKDAEPVFLKALTLDTASIAVWNGLGQIYREYGRFDDAATAYQKYTELEPANIYGWNNLAFNLIQAKRHTEAEPVCRKAIELDSANYFAWSNLGLVLLQSGQYAEAESTLQRLFAINPKLIDASLYLGKVYLRTGRMDEARKTYTNIIDLNPNNAGGYIGMASLLVAEGKLGDALQFVEQAIQKKANYMQLEVDDDLKPMHQLPEWQELMKKYFPDQAKD